MTDDWRAPPARTLGGVLIGGGSRRMGRPKQLMTIDGVTMVERVVHALSGHVDQVALLGGGEIPATLDGLPRIDDAPGCRGPLAGLLAALRWAPDACWVIAGCDMPRIEPTAIEWLLQSRRPGDSMVLPKIDGRLEPLLALYLPDALPLMERAAAGGELAPRFMAEDASALVVEPPVELRPCWFNVNTQADLDQLRVN